MREINDGAAVAKSRGIEDLPGILDARTNGLEVRKNKYDELLAKYGYQRHLTCIDALQPVFKLFASDIELSIAAENILEALVKKFNKKPKFKMPKK